MANHHLKNLLVIKIGNTADAYAIAENDNEKDALVEVFTAQIMAYVNAVDDANNTEREEGKDESMQIA